MKRIRLSYESWQQLILQQENSGLGVSAFCAQQGLSTKTFYRRRKALRLDLAQAPRSFIKIESTPVSLPPVTPAQSITLRYGEITLSLPVSTDHSWIADLMKALS